ncbi:MAG: hypothetical protein F4017_11675 [Acidimicrobiaceae bacterium]|nr:hypothetical protein [Acidimicrobiaceae bacterium]
MTDVSVGLVFDIGGRGDQSFNDSAAAGIERAAAELGITSPRPRPSPTAPTGASCSNSPLTPTTS